VLENLIVDCYRRRAARKRLTSQIVAVTPDAVGASEELGEQVCGCIRGVLTTLRPAYAEMLHRIELEEEPLRRVARELSITPGAASVRLHRALRALLEGLRRTCGACFEHSCLDCTCRRR
jgi:RNA polymerase sigma-70 factor (ECF subfamily)